MAHRVFISGVSVYDKDSPDGKYETIPQGELLPAYVDEYQRFVLSQTGMVKFEPDTEQPEPGADNPRTPDPVRLAEHPPLGSRLAASELNTPAGVASQRLLDDAGSSDDTVPDLGDGAEGGRPTTAAPKAEWVSYAVSQGTDRDEAEAMTKAELVERFGTPR